MSNLDKFTQPNSAQSISSQPTPVQQSNSQSTSQSNSQSTSQSNSYQDDIHRVDLDMPLKSLSLKFMEKVLDIDFVVGLGLVITMIVSLFLGGEKLAEYIAAGLIGYIGRGKISKPDTYETVVTTTHQVNPSTGDSTPTTVRKEQRKVEN